MLKADVWRDHLLQEEAALNVKLTELEAEGDDKRFVDAREEASSRLAEVHTRLADMEAESGPARAAALLAGTYRIVLHHYSKYDSRRRQVWDLAKKTKNVRPDPSVVAGGTHPTGLIFTLSNQSLGCVLPLLAPFSSRSVFIFMYLREGLSASKPALLLLDEPSNHSAPFFIHYL